MALHYTGFPHFGIKKIQGLFQGIFKDIFNIFKDFNAENLQPI